MAKERFKMPASPLKEFWATQLIISIVSTIVVNSSELLLLSILKLFSRILVFHEIFSTTKKNLHIYILNKNSIN